MTSFHFLSSLVILTAIVIQGNALPTITRLNDASHEPSVTSQWPNKLLEVIFARSKRQSSNSTTTNNTVIMPKSTVSVTYMWSPWQPQVEVTCRYDPKARKMVVIGTADCAARGRTKQFRKCETKAGAGVGKTANDVQCGSGSERNVSCDMEQLCGAWGRWSRLSPICRNATCRYGPMIIENNTYGRYRLRTCDNKFVTFHENCTFIALTQTGRAVSPDPDPDPLDPDPEVPDHSDLLTSSTKIIIFSVSGVVMVALLGFAGSRLSRTVKFASLAHSRERTISSSVEANDIQYTSIGQTSNPSTPRVVIVNQASGQPMRRQQGRCKAPPMSNLSVIHEEETDDVFEDETESEHNSDVSYDDVSTADGTNDVMMKERSDSEAALDYMDEIITQIEDDSSDVFVNLNDVVPNSEYRRSADSSLLTDYGWSPRDHVTDNRPIAIEKLKDGSGEGFLSASALSLASASLLLPSSPVPKSRMTSSLSSCSMTDDYSSVTGSLTSTSSLKAVRRVPSRFVELKHFASMPDMTKAAQAIPDVDEVLADSIEWRQT